VTADPHAHVDTVRGDEKFQHNVCRDAGLLRAPHRFDTIDAAPTSQSAVKAARG